VKIVHASEDVTKYRVITSEGGGKHVLRTVKRRHLGSTCAGVNAFEVQRISQLTSLAKRIKRLLGCFGLRVGGPD
jgi:hypothetical protein